MDNIKAFFFFFKIKITFFRLIDLYGAVTAPRNFKYNVNLIFFFQKNLNKKIIFKKENKKLDTGVFTLFFFFKKFRLTNKRYLINLFY